jgi:hypothetical protein
VSTAVPTVLTLVVEAAPPGAVVEVTAVRGAATAVPASAPSTGSNVVRDMLEYQCRAINKHLR